MKIGMPYDTDELFIIVKALSSIRFYRLFFKIFFLFFKIKWIKRGKRVLRGNEKRKKTETNGATIGGRCEL